MSSVLTFEGIHAGYGQKEILSGASVEVEKGCITGIIGPNGCGKSTLIKTLFGIVPHSKGDIFLEDKSQKTLSRKQISSMIGYVGQDSAVVFDFTVEEVVGMALYNQKKKKDTAKVLIHGALEELGIENLAQRNIQNLSGGERKMAFLARAIAQGVDTIILDEPTNHLDINHQLFLMNYLKNSEKTILIVIHDLRLAAHFCDRLYLMENGKIHCSGTPEEVLTMDNVSKVFGIKGEMELRSIGRDFFMDFEAVNE